MAIFKTFIRPHLHYGDVVFDRASKETRHQGLKFLQYSPEVVITGAISETPSEKLSQALHLETLKSSCWLSKLCLFCKTIKEESPA